MNRDNFIYAAIITGSLDLIRDLPEGDEIDMCEERKEGEKREKKTVLSLLKVKLGNVSNQLEPAFKHIRTPRQRDIFFPALLMISIPKYNKLQTNI